MIKQLPKEIISKIAAGEVITSPTNIIKELIENSIDANSTTIIIEISNKLTTICITDNGDGINKEDFTKLCERHCTSKFTGNLLDISTFGFRGEALSSISLCSKIGVESKKSENEIGYVAEFQDDVILKINQKAMNNGTKIKVDDIFYNNIFRRKHFYNRKDEIHSIFYLIGNYSICYTNVKFQLYIDNILKDDFISHFEANKNARNFSLKNTGDRNIVAKKEIINTIYKTDGNLIEKINEKGLFVFSNSSFSLRKYIFILFVNGRLVENKILKDRLSKIYKDLLPKNRFPFIYIEINTEFENVDINVHPCKKEIIFYEEDSIIEEIVNSILLYLSNTQEIKQEALDSDKTVSYMSPFKNIYTDPQSSSLFEICEEKHLIKSNANKKIFKLKSLEKIRNEITEKDADFMKNCVYVGIYDHRIAIQYGPLLLLCNYEFLIKEYLRQKVVYEFGNYDYIRVNIKYDNEMSVQHKNILTEYFNLEIIDGFIVKIPVIDKIIIQDNVSDFLSEYSNNELVDEEAIFRYMIRKFVDLFYINMKFDESFFNVIKRNIIGTEEALKQFTILTSLNELYKMFERC